MTYNEANETFEADEKFVVSGSSFVEEFVYDRDSKELLVYLDSGRGYLYRGVPESTFTNFKAAHSKGQFYNNWVKRGGFGPATEVAWDTEIVLKPSPMEVVQSNVTTTNGTGTTFTLTGTNATFNLDTPTITLSDDGGVLLHTVSFTVEGGNSVKTYDVLALSVADAVESLGDAMNALGLEFDVKGVYISFE